MGGCYDSAGIYSFNKETEDSDRAFGYLEYPPCGTCSECSYACDYDREAIRKVAEERNNWLLENPHSYICKWTHGEDYGNFLIRAGSLEDARKKAQESMGGWESLLVEPF